MIKNAGRRTVMKQILNSSWGKLAQNEDVTTVCFLDDFHELLLLANDRSVEVTSLEFIDENVARVTLRKTSSSLVTMKNRNVVIAFIIIIITTLFKHGDLSTTYNYYK